jgi:xenotropic and polytropic retrovirus receptor 1
MKVHLVNAGKYFSVILIQFANIFKHKIRGDLTLIIFVVISVISTLYAFSWDLYMDWGLIRSKEKGRYMLRHKVLLPKWFYYYAIVTNLVLRFSWITLLYAAYMPVWINNS